MPMFFENKLNALWAHRFQNTKDSILARSCRLTVESAADAGVIQKPVNSFKSKDSLDLVLLSRGAECDCYCSVFANNTFKNINRNATSNHLDWRVNLHCR